MAENTTVPSERQQPDYSYEDWSEIFPDLTQAEEVVVWASILVGFLGLSAVVLRLVMPLVRRKCGKAVGGSKGLSKTALNGSSG